MREGETKRKTNREGKVEREQVPREGGEGRERRTSATRGGRGMRKENK